MKIHRLSLLLLGLLVLAAAVWFGFPRPGPPAPWLRVEAPRHALAGKPFPVRITLASPEPGTQLFVDLHWATSRREPQGFLSNGSLQPTDAHERTYGFELPASVREDLGFVYAVVFLSPSGRWEDRTAAASSALVPVLEEGSLGQLEPLPVYELQETAPASANVPALRMSIAAIWLASSIALWTHRTKRGLAVACLAAAVWELSNVETSLAQYVRAAALEHHLYYERFSPQALITLAILATIAVSIVPMLLRTRAMGADLVKAALWLYAGISLVGLVSLHETDRLLASAVVALPVAQVAKLFLAAAVLVFAIRGVVRGDPAN